MPSRRFSLIFTWSTVSWCTTPLKPDHWQFTQLLFQTHRPAMECNPRCVHIHFPEVAEEVLNLPRDQDVSEYAWLEPGSITSTRCSFCNGWDVSCNQWYCSKNQNWKPYYYVVYFQVLIVRRVWSTPGFRWILYRLNLCVARKLFYFLLDHLWI